MHRRGIFSKRSQNDAAAARGYTELAIILFGSAYRRQGAGKEFWQSPMTVCQEADDDGHASILYTAKSCKPSSRNTRKRRQLISELLKRRLISKVISDEKIHVLLMSLLLGSHVVLAENSLNALSQEAPYKNWLTSRCIGKSTDSERTKQDAFRSASAYLELSKLPMDAFEQGENSLNSTQIK